MENYIVGLGEILWDLLPAGKQLGGAPANFAYHTSQFGLNSIAVSAIGDDELGSEIVQTLSQKHLTTHFEIVPQPTGVVKVTLQGDGIPQYDICQDVAYDNIPFTAKLEAIAKNACAVCFGSLAQRNSVSHHTIMQFLDATAPNALRIFDINLRQSWYSRDVVEQSLSRCNVLKLNDEEIPVLASLLGMPAVSGESDFEATAQSLIAQYGLKYVILTCGATGSYVFSSDNGVSYQSTPAVAVADTVGAGDSFTAAFVASILQGGTMQQAHTKAVSVAAYVCTQHGAMPQLPSSLTNNKNV